LPEDEIVAQLLFGKAVQNMTPWQALQLASAINQLRGGDSLDLLLATRDTLGLDTLEIETGDEAETPAILRIGRYLNSRVYLELDTELSADRDLRGRVELELTPNLFLETQTGGGRSRLHLRWRRNY
jgi:translocation and assembly module TamB